MRETSLFLRQQAQAKKGKGEKRAAGVAAASVATAVDLGGEEGGAPPAKRSNRSLLEEAVCAMSALLGDSSRRTWLGAQRHVFLRVRIQQRRVRVDSIWKKNDALLCTPRSACSLPGAFVQLLSQPHLHAQSELHPFAQSPFICPPIPPSTLVSRASHTWSCE
jgi:hypothetical protein